MNDEDSARLIDRESRSDMIENPGETALFELLAKKDIWHTVPENPIIQRGSANSWDADSAIGFSIAEEDGSFRLWYEARAKIESTDGTRVVSQVGHARSIDGRHWVKDTAPALRHGNAGSWDAQHVYSPKVLKSNHSYLLYYHGNAVAAGLCDIGLACSSDGIHWERYQHNPVLWHGGPGDPDELTVACPNVVTTDSGYAMIYCQSGLNGQRAEWTIALARSRDGVHWEKHGTVIRLADENRNLSSPCLLRIRKRYYLWAWSFIPEKMDENDVRLFWSIDLVQWQPVWDSGWINDWMDQGVSRQFFMPNVFLTSKEELFMLYPIRVVRGTADTGLAVTHL